MLQSNLIIQPNVIEKIKSHLRHHYPEVGVGFLFGNEKNARTVSYAYPVQNIRKNNHLKGYQIDPLDYLKAEQFAEEKGLQILGIYQSSVDQPNHLSNLDQHYALPFFSYLKVAVYKGEIKEITSFRFHDQLKRLAEEPIFSPKAQLNY